ncbi:MAG TPA: ankyrin repeat domain-containing protein [Akkermansia muciniphila]|nr:ankyrin repeat domain-containing protein [Akkermansia muciniphila]
MKKYITLFLLSSLFLSSCDKLTSSDKQEIDRQVARLSPEKEADFVLGKMLLTIKNGGDINDCETRHPYIGGVACEYPTALHIAVYQRKPEIAKFLLKLGADPNAHISKNEISALHNAVFTDQYDLVKSLLDRGANPDEVGKHTSSLLGDACSQYRESPQIAIELIQRHANVRITGVDGVTPLHDLVKRSDSDYTSEWGTVFDLLIRNGAEVNCRDAKGKTPLHEVDNLHMAKLLIANGADINGKDNLGRTPLFYIKNKDVIQYLIENGSILDIKDKDKATVLHYILSKDFGNLKYFRGLKFEADRIKFIVEKGINVNIQDIDGNTPLHLIMREPYCEYISEWGAYDKFGADDLFPLLVTSQTDVTIKNKKNKTSLQLAYSISKETGDRLKEELRKKSKRESAASLNVANEGDETQVTYGDKELLSREQINANALREEIARRDASFADVPMKRMDWMRSAERQNMINEYSRLEATEANVKAQTKEREPALMLAVDGNNTDCVKALREAVANAKSKDEGKRKDYLSPEEAQKPVVLQDISSGNLNAGKMSIANIKRTLKDAKEDDQLLLNDLASVVTDLYRSKQEISLVRKQNIKDEKQISSLESWAVSCMTPSALTGRTDPSGAENARRKARILEGAIQQRNTGIRNKLNAIADRARELESKLRENGRAEDADMLRKSVRYFLKDL